MSQTAIARFIRHKVGTMARDVYSEGSTESRAVETAAKVHYPKTVGAAALGLVRLPI